MQCLQVPEGALLFTPFIWQSQLSEAAFILQLELWLRYSKNILFKLKSMHTDQTDIGFSSFTCLPPCPFH
jgi:hypothetical protein